MSSFRNADVNPCMEESSASTKCMDDNNYKKDMCTAHFLKYRQCKKFWHTVMINRRRDGVEPAMPTAVERQQILDSLKTMPY